MNSWCFCLMKLFKCQNTQYKAECILWTRNQERCLSDLLSLKYSCLVLWQLFNSSLWYFQLRCYFPKTTQTYKDDYQLELWRGQLVIDWYVELQLNQPVTETIVHQTFIRLHIFLGLYFIFKNVTKWCHCEETSSHQAHLHPTDQYRTKRTVNACGSYIIYICSL